MGARKQLLRGALRSMSFQAGLRTGVTMSAHRLGRRTTRRHRRHTRMHAPRLHAPHASCAKMCSSSSSGRLSSCSSSMSAASCTGSAQAALRPRSRRVSEGAPVVGATRVTGAADCDAAMVAQAGSGPGRAVQVNGWARARAAGGSSGGGGGGGGGGACCCVEGEGAGKPS